jgi:type I restriction enzyme S subunit
MNNITTSGSLDFTRRRLVPPKHRSVKGALLEPGDVLFNATNSPDLVGKTAVFTGEGKPAVYSNHFIRLRPDGSRLIPEYLARWLHYQFSKGVFRAVCRQWVNQATVDRKTLLAMSVPLPSVDQQNRIVVLLGTVDFLRTRRRAAVEATSGLRDSIFLETFDLSPKALKADLGDYLTFITSGGRGWARYYTESGSRFIRSLDVRMNEIDSDAAVYVTPPNSAEAERTRVRAGDVLLTITGSLIGRVAPVPAGLAGSYISQHVAILRSDQARMLPEFLSFYLSLASGGQREIARLQYGQTKPGLNFEQIRRFRVPAVSVAEQRSFVRKLAKANEVIRLHRVHLAALDELFASLQSRAFQDTCEAGGN